jgi:hypothetical protein
MAGVFPNFFHYGALHFRFVGEVCGSTIHSMGTGSSARAARQPDVA